MRVALQKLVRFFLLLVFLSLNVSGKESIRIASYNLRNYLITDRLVEGQWKVNYPKPEAEKINHSKKYPRGTSRYFSDSGNWRPTLS